MSSTQSQNKKKSPAMVKKKWMITLNLDVDPKLVIQKLMLVKKYLECVKLPVTNCRPNNNNDNMDGI